MAKHNRYEILPPSLNRGNSIDDNEKGWYKMDAMVKLFSVEEVGGLLGISRSAVYNFLNSKKLPAIKLESRTMVRMIDLMAFIESRECYEGGLNEI